MSTTTTKKIIQVTSMVSVLISTIPQVQAYKNLQNLDRVRNYISKINKEDAGKRNRKTGGDTWLKGVSLISGGKLQKKYPSMFPPTVVYQYVSENKKLLKVIQLDQEIRIAKKEIEKTAREKRLESVCDSNKGGDYHALLKWGYALQFVTISPEGWTLVSFTIKPKDCKL